MSEEDKKTLWNGSGFDVNSIAKAFFNGVRVEETVDKIIKSITDEYDIDEVTLEEIREDLKYHISVIFKGACARIVTSIKSAMEWAVDDILESAELVLTAYVDDIREKNTSNNGTEEVTTITEET